MPQEFEQAQSASASQESEDIIESVGVQVDGANDALDAVLDDIESVLESNAEEYVGSFVQKGVTAAIIPQLRLMRKHCMRFIPSPVFSALKPNMVSA